MGIGTVADATALNSMKQGKNRGAAGAGALGQGQAPTTTVAAPEAALGLLRAMCVRQHRPRPGARTPGYRELAIDVGDVMKVMEASPDSTWLKVRFEGEEGYVPADSVELETPPPSRALDILAHGLVHPAAVAPAADAQADTVPQGWNKGAKVVMKDGDKSIVGTILKKQGMRARVDFHNGKNPGWFEKGQLEPVAGGTWSGGGYRKRRNKTRKQRKKNIKKRTKKSTRKRTKKNTKKRTKKNKN